MVNKKNEILHLHGAMWFKPYGWLSERPGIGVKYNLSEPSFRFITRALAEDAIKFDGTLAELARRTRTLNDGDASKLSVTSFETFSSLSNSTCMPESPLLHLSRRWCLVFRRSLLVRQINGPNRYLIMSTLSNDGFFALTIEFALLIDVTELFDEM